MKDTRLSETRRRLSGCRFGLSFSRLGQSGSSGGFLLMNVKSNDDLFKKHFNSRKCTFNGKTELKHNQSLYLAHSGLDRLS